MTRADADTLKAFIETMVAPVVVPPSPPVIVPPVVPPVVPPTVPPNPPTDSSVTVTADWITTDHDKIPNFGGRPTITAIDSGAWSDPSVWTSNRVPTEGDIVYIPWGVVIGITSGLVDAPKVDVVSVAGRLVFLGAVDSRLNVTTLIVLPSGELHADVASKKTEIVINDVPLDLARDPQQYGNGIICFGKFTLKGRPLARTHVRVAVEPLAGHTTLTLAEPCLDWRVNDSIVIGDTRNLTYDGNAGTDRTPPQFERRKIAAVSTDGKTLTLDAPLLFAHKAGRACDGVIDVWPTVGLTTRNVVIKSENSNGTRGHVFVTANADFDAKFVQFGGLGRTKWIGLNDEALPVVAKSVTGPTNIDGRHAVHFHHCTKSVHLEVCSVFCPVLTPKNNMPFVWGVALHDTHRSTIKDNVLFNWGGAGIAVVGGNEWKNEITGNFICRTTGFGGTPPFTKEHSVGLEGGGIWSRSAATIMRDNVVTDSLFGFMVWLGEYDTGADVPAWAIGTDTPVRNSAGKVNMKAVPPVIDRCEAGGGGMLRALGFWNVGLGGNGRWDVYAGERTVVTDFTAWHFKQNGFLNYQTNNVTLLRPKMRGDVSVLAAHRATSVGVSAGDYIMFNLEVLQPDIQGLYIGFSPSASSGGSIQTPVGRTLLAGPTVIRGGRIQCYIGADISPMWSVGDPNIHAPRSHVIDGVSMPPVPGVKTRIEWGPQVGLRMRHGYGGETTNLRQLDTAEVRNHNGDPAANYRVYYREAAADAIYEPTVMYPNGKYKVLACPEAGLTNAQAKVVHGVCYAGAVAPATCVTVPGIVGLCEPMGM